jgi:hypothetical protein
MGSGLEGVARDLGGAARFRPKTPRQASHADEKWGQFNVGRKIANVPVFPVFSLVPLGGQTEEGARVDGHFGETGGGQGDFDIDFLIEGQKYPKKVIEDEGADHEQQPTSDPQSKKRPGGQSAQVVPKAIAGRAGEESEEGQGKENGCS